MDRDVTLYQITSVMAERVFQKIYFRNIQIRNRLYSHRHYYFRFHRSRDCHTNAKECGIAHDTGLRRRIGYPRCHLIGIFLFHIMSDLGR